MTEVKIIGTGKYAVGEHQQFVDRKGRKVRVIRGISEPVPVGEAYAFFNCKASKAEIERELPTIRWLAQTSNNLEIYLMEGRVSLRVNEDSELGQIADEAKKANIRYAMQANCPNLTNRQTADELSGILNQTYQSPLFGEREEFNGTILYKENGRYISRD